MAQKEVEEGQEALQMVQVEGAEDREGQVVPQAEAEALVDLSLMPML